MLAALPSGLMKREFALDMRVLTLETRGLLLALAWKRTHAEGVVALGKGKFALKPGGWGLTLT